MGHHYDDTDYCGCGKVGYCTPRCPDPPREYPKVELHELPKGPAEIKFQIREYIGVEVLSAPPGFSREEILKGNGFPEGFKPEPVTSKDLPDGTVVLIPMLLGGLGVFSVERSERGEVYARGGQMMGMLEYGTDDRNCWVCGGMMNLAGLKKLEIFKDAP